MSCQPNILFIMPDQFRGDCLSAQGHPVILTPNLDELAGAGTLFERAYSTCPSCVPSRRSLLTGLNPCHNGLVGMMDGKPISQPTFPAILRDAGYQTVLIGRTMHQFPPTARYGFEQTILGATHVSDDAYAQDLSRSTDGRGSVQAVGLSFNGWTARPWPFDETLHQTAWAAEKCRSFLREADETCPLFLTASFSAPHPPLSPPAFYFDRYLKMDLPSPSVGKWARVPQVLPHVEASRVCLKGEALRSVLAGYFGLINHIDDQLLWLIADFKARSKRQKREWVIVFSSDHGEMLGDHHYFRKCEPYEGSARIPLIIASSSGLGFRTQARVKSPVCLEDLFPTFLDLAGAEYGGAPINGKSLVPLLTGEAGSVREILHGEHAMQYSAEQANHFLTDGRWKYIWRSMTGDEQLFDLETDPHELEDKTDTCESTLNRFRRDLIARLADRPEGFVSEGSLRPVAATPMWIAQS